MYDNYSTKGNYNPYTGKPGWIRPEKYMKYIRSVSRPSSQNHFNKLQKYLNNGDSIKYFSIVSQLAEPTMSFCTALYSIECNRINEANGILKKIISRDDIEKQMLTIATDLYNLTFSQIQADKEAEILFKASDNYRINLNLEEYENALNNVEFNVNLEIKYIMSIGLTS